MANPKKAPVLSLSTVIERSTVSIDGTAYELRNADELPWLMFRGYAQTFQQAGAIIKVPLLDRTETQERELDQLLDPIVRALVLAPHSVLQKLTSDQRLAILTIFSMLRTMKPNGRSAGARRLRVPHKGRRSNGTK